MAVETGILYLVGTPIGNLEDITLRAIRILQTVDWIAAEDTRHTGQLLKHFQITTPQISFHAHNCQSRLPELLARLEQGSIALVTDAGMPSISDPGWELVEACIQGGFTVVPIPGPTACITALIASGMPTDRFVFEGFLPIENQMRQERLQFLEKEPRTIIFYEAPHRLLRSLTDLQTYLGNDRLVVVARELTKRFEHFWRGTLQEALEYFIAHPPRGEFTLILQGSTPDSQNWTEAQVCIALQQLIEQGLSRSEASRQLAELTGMPKRQIYQLSLAIGGES